MGAMMNRELNLSWLYHRVFNKSNTTGATSGAETTYRSNLRTTNNLQLQEIGNAINYMSTHLNKETTLKYYCIYNCLKIPNG
jgi:hypothetical protein